MILLSASDISRQFDADPVFRGLSCDVADGEKIGLVGPNGAGKTTLLRLLSGQDDPDEGRVERANSAVFAVLAQEARFDADRTLFDEARAGLDHLYRLQREAEAVAHRMAETRDEQESERLHRRWDLLQSELQRHDAYHLDHRVEEILHGLGFTPDQYDRRVSTFSGGQQNRASLARVLLRAPDLMFLDEPTNHLDIAATEWLEDHLSRTPQAVLLVSHDRYFLDRVCTRILELHFGVLASYPGNFSAYWKLREERRKVLDRTAEKQQEFVARTEDFIRRNAYGQKSAQANDREKKLARLEVVETIRDIAALPMRFKPPSRTGDWVIDAVGLSKGFPDPAAPPGTPPVPLFEDFTLRVHREDRLAVLGPNGSGKTTLLRTLLGELEPDAGTVRFGTGVKIGYYDQQLSGVDPALDAVEAVRPPDDPTMLAPRIRDLLARFGIRGDRAFQKVGSMSGGEKSKVALARLAALDVNVLVLDEPTNHLDLWARASLEAALKEYPGTLVFVSHDRYFVDRVATGVVVLDRGGWRFHAGNYSDFVAFRAAIDADPDAATSAARGTASKSMLVAGAGSASSSGNDATSDGTGRSGPTATKPDDSHAAPARRRRKFKYRKLDDIEADVEEAEEEVAKLEAALVDPSVLRDGERVKTVMQDYEAAKLRLAELYEHWEEAVELE